MDFSFWEVDMEIQESNRRAFGKSGSVHPWQSKLQRRESP